MKKKSQNILNAAKYTIDHPETSITQAAKMFGVDRNAVSKTIPEIEYYTIFKDDGYCYGFDDNELEMINYYLEHPHIKYLELQRMFNSTATSRTFKNWLDILGEEYQPHYKYSNNRDAFNSIETEEDAYWLGFITADGYINETNGWLNISLGEIDIEHLKKFLRYMNCTEEEIPQMIKQHCGGAYTRDNITYSIIICGRQLVNNLKQYGLFQGKSGKEIPYKCKTTELEIAYIRGLLDGDGYIRSTEYGIGLVGSQEILEYVRNFFIEQLNWQNASEKYIHPHGTIYKFAVGGKNISKDILHLLYDNSNIYLDRKYNLYEQYCRD